MTAASITLVSVFVCLLAVLHSSFGQHITITPRTDNEGRFEGQEFRRLCSISGVTGPTTVEWLHDGNSVMSGSDIILELHLPSVQLEDAGEYVCRVTLGDGTVVGPNSAGILTVLELSAIDAPSDQFVLLGSTATLTCSFAGSFPTWFRNYDVVHEGIISNTSLSDEGQYRCDLYLPAHRTRIEMTIVLHVILPVIIISSPEDHQIITGNVHVKLTVEFQGRATQNMVATWYRDGTPLSASRIQTTFSSSNVGTTCLSFDAITRGDAGVYRVEVVTHQGSGTIPNQDRRAETSFQVEVKVPPRVPSGPVITEITSTSILVRWALTNQTLDEGPDNLTFTVSYTNNTIVRQYILGPSWVEMPVTTVPGMEYWVTVTASNQDGTRTTDPVVFRTPPGLPLITSLEVTKLSGTEFNISVSLAYTGGGAITHFQVSFRDTGTTHMTPLGRIPATPSPESSLVYHAVVSHPEFAESASLSFLVSAVNREGFVSLEGMETHESVTTEPIQQGSITPVPTPTAPTTNPTGTEDTSLQSFPLVTVVIIAVCVSVVSTVVVMAGILLLVCCCKHKRKHMEKKYEVNTLNNLEKELGPENAMLNRTDSIPMHLRNGSVHNMNTSTSTIDRSTPSIKHHRRTPSDLSSTYKKPYSPSTTASSSPSTFMMLKHKQRMENGGSNLAVENGVLRRSMGETEFSESPIPVREEMGDNDAQPTMANNHSNCSSETDLSQMYPHPATSPSLVPGESLRSLPIRASSMQGSFGFIAHHVPLYDSQFISDV